MVKNMINTVSNLLGNLYLRFYKTLGLSKQIYQESSLRARLIEKSRSKYR